MKKIIILLLSILLVNYAEAQNKKTFVLGVIDSINSVQLSETRILNIYLPDGYQQNDTVKYPVIYLLDGSADEDFIHISGIVQFLNFSWVNVLPKSIVVGIANVDRRRDFTFPTQNKEDLKTCPTSGSSEKFISFIEKELQPYIQKNYKTNSQKTIIGESLGGLLATEILLKRPALFNDYIIVSPSLWWNDESLLSQAQESLKKNLNTNIKVYVSVGNEGKQMQNDVNKLVSILQGLANEKLKLYYYPFPEENHATIMHRSVYKAFEMLNKKE